MLTLTLQSNGDPQDALQAASIAYNNGLEVVVVGADGKEICKATPQLAVAEDPVPPVAVEEPVTPAEPVVESTEPTPV